MKKQATVLALAVALLACGMPSAAAPVIVKQDTTFKKDVLIEGDLVIEGTLTPALAANRSFPVDLQSRVRNDDGTTLAAAAAAGKFGITNGTHAAPALELTGEAAQNNTKTDYCSTVFVMPPEYVDAGNVTVTVTVKYSGTGTVSTNTIDCQAFELAADGTCGADICATAAQNMAATATARAFTITGTNLVRGDKLLLYFTGVITETGGVNSITGAITDIKVTFSAQG